MYYTIFVPSSLIILTELWVVYYLCNKITKCVVQVIKCIKRMSVDVGQLKPVIELTTNENH